MLLWFVKIYERNLKKLKFTTQRFVHKFLQTRVAYYVRRIYICQGYEGCGRRSKTIIERAVDPMSKRVESKVPGLEREADNTGPSARRY